MKQNTRTSIIFKTSLALMAALFLTAAVQAAETKIAVIDFKRVFDNYFKRKLAQAQIDDQKADAEKKLKGMSDEYQKANEDYKKLIDGATDQALSSQEQDKRKSAAEKKLLEIKEIQQSADAFRQNSDENLRLLSRRLVTTIVKDMREVIDAKAKEIGYTLVIDIQSGADVPVVLFNNGQNDITEEILSQLNATAPRALQKSDDTTQKATEKKDEKKEGRK
jgi:outer membrane protein